MPDTERGFTFLKMNDRGGKPRRRGITEIRGPYYTPMGRRYLEDVLETMGAYVDSLKFAGGSFTLMPRAAVKDLYRDRAQARCPGLDRRLHRVRPDPGQGCRPAVHRGM